MNFLITGGAGFLGSGLANLLIRQGHNIRVIDDLSTGNPDRLSPDIHFTRGDINDRPKLWTLLQEVDCVYHLAARVSVPESMLYPRDYNLVNVGGTVTLMEAMRDVGVKRVIFISSGAVYGHQTHQPLKESTTPHPDSPYAVSKLSSEYYVRTIGKLWGIECVCLRVFNAYGPGQHIPAAHAPVIPTFLRQAIHNGTFVIQGNGLQTRDYVFVDDVVSAMAAAATAPGIDQMVLNIGSGKETSIHDLAKLVVKVTGSKPEIMTNTQASPGVSRMCADVSLAAHKLKYKTLVPLEVGLKLTFEQDENLKKMNGKSTG
ncbi:MAG: NAD-dependent epimerase/dehydratase family protein [Anaerolineaceae bacterium]